MEIEDLLHRLTLSDGPLRTLLDTGLTRSESSISILMRSLRDVQSSLPSLDFEAVQTKIRDMDSLTHDLAQAKQVLSHIQSDIQAHSANALSQPSPNSGIPDPNAMQIHPEKASESDWELNMALREWNHMVEMLERKVRDVVEQLVSRRKELQMCRGFEEMRV